ncbi:hypothetical protein Mapa_016238 [Marchantia paleacea]|nr:hypothetical protein Mapa_016238 [Marchantia paleacea]
MPFPLWWQQCSFQTIFSFSVYSSNSCTAPANRPAAITSSKAVEAPRNHLNATWLPPLYSMNPMAIPHTAPVMAARGYAVPDPSSPIPPKKITASTPSRMTMVNGIRKRAYLLLVLCSVPYFATLSTVTLVSFFSHLALHVSTLIMEKAIRVMSTTAIRLRIPSHRASVLSQASLATV